MAKKNGRDYTYLIWKEPKSRQQYLIAKLSKNGKYEFEYDFEIEEALEKGFKLLIAFDNIKEKYTSDRLFSSFSSRIPDKRRKDIGKILDKYGLSEYDEYELLKKSGGRLPIDDLEFIDPILDNGEDPIERRFYVAGSRHYIGCEGKECVKSFGIDTGDKLYLELEPENKFDEYAIKIKNRNKDKIGYIPRYYNKELIGLLNNGAKYELIVDEINKDNNCNECLKVLLKVMIN